MNSGSNSRMKLLGIMVKWLNKTWRDKLCKMLQFACLLLARIFRDHDYYSLQFETLYQSIREARKIFRMLKSILEYQKLISILLDDRDNWVKVFRVLAQICFFFYWFFDNISIACKIKIIRGDYLKNNTVAAVFWLASLLISIPVLIVESTNNPDSKEATKQIEDAIKYTFDILPAAKQSQVLSKFFKVDISSELQGIGGFTSAFISTYQVIRESSASSQSTS